MTRTGNSPNDAIDRTSRIVPIVPLKMCPGMISSSTINPRPIQKKMNARLGSNRVCRKFTNAPIVWSWSTAPAVCSVTSVPFPSRTFVPSSWVRRSCVDVAIRSITLSWSASSAVMLAASVTKVAASFALRPYVCARPRMFAVASFFTFSPSVPVISPPESPMGVDAPTLVAGAMAATGADRRMNAPAEAARAPLGAT